MRYGRMYGTYSNEKNIIKHKVYHFGSAPNTYQYETKQGTIGGGTYNGAGIQKCDKNTHPSKIKYDYTRET